MSYKRVLFYFMSGTGNTFRVMRWMEECARRRGAETSVHQIETRGQVSEIGGGAETLVGLLMPTHAFTAPWPLIRFAWRLPRKTGAHAFVLSTRAGVRFRGAILPGLEGTANYLIALLLALRGYRVRGGLSIDMPSNWMAAHSGYRPEHVDTILAAARPKAESFVTVLLGGATWFGGRVSLALGVLLLPVSLGYLLAGRFFLTQLFFANNRCTSCHLCAEACPFRAIRMLGSPKSRPFWTYSCESCMRCMAYCPEKAIEVGHSWAVLLYFVSSIPVSLWLMGEMGHLLPWGGLAGGDGIAILIQYPFYLFSMLLAYTAFFILLRSPAINAFFTLTAFTRRFRRYHEPATALKDLTAS